MTTQRKPIIAGNWKMNKTASEARDLATAIIPLVKDVKNRDVVLAPPFTSLQAVAESIKKTDIALAGLNLYWED